MGVFDDLITTAEELIEDNGETSTIKRRVDGTPADSTKPWETGAVTYTSYTVSAVWLNYSLNRMDGQILKEGDGYLIQPYKTTNGTFLNGVELQAGKSYPLKDGDKVLFGFRGVELIFRLP